jgi:hypothetical protein
VDGQSGSETLVVNDNVEMSIDCHSGTIQAVNNSSSGGQKTRVWIIKANYVKVPTSFVDTITFTDLGNITVLKDSYKVSQNFVTITVPTGSGSGQGR